MFTKTATAQDVHEEFDKQAELLVLEANAILENSKNDATVKQKLRSMGFTNSESIPDEAKIKLAKHIRYYEFGYPQNNFLTEEKIETICKKYGLLLAEPKDYTGAIPSANQKEIANFKLHSQDEYITINRKFTQRELVVIRKKAKGGLLGSQLTVVMSKIWGYNYVLTRYQYSQQKEKYDAERFRFVKENHEFMIVAHPSLLSLKNKKVVGEYKLVDKDPVVLCKMDYGYLQVSVWGDESKIEGFKNKRKN